MLASTAACAEPRAGRKPAYPQPAARQPIADSVSGLTRPCRQQTEMTLACVSTPVGFADSQTQICRPRCRRANRTILPFRLRRRAASQAHPMRDNLKGSRSLLGAEERHQRRRPGRQPARPGFRTAAAGCSRALVVSEKKRGGESRFHTGQATSMRKIGKGQRFV